ncbi:hypothetical protein D9M71_162990 [compost metagenome]
MRTFSDRPRCRQLALDSWFGRRQFAIKRTLLGLDRLAAYRCRRGELFLHAPIDFTQLRNHLLALLSGSPPAVGRALDQFEQVQGDLAGEVHHLEPRQVGEHGQAKQEQGNEHQRTALHVQGIARQFSEAFTQSTAGRRRQARGGMEMDMRQGSTGQHQKHQPDQTPGKQPAAPLPRFVALTEDLPGLDRQQQRENIREIAQDHEQDIGEPGAGTAGGVLYLIDIAGVAETGVGLVVGQQCHPQVQAQGPHGNQCTFLEPVVQLLTPERNGIGCSGGFLQNASFPALVARPTVD